jgi:hypothetical protein
MSYLSTFIKYVIVITDMRGSVVVKALCYNRKVAGSRPDETNTYFNLRVLFSRTMPWALLSL